MSLTGRPWPWTYLWEDVLCKKSPESFRWFMNYVSTPGKIIPFNPLNAELNPIWHLLALLGVHHSLHVSRIRVKSLTLRLLMSYIYIYGAPVLVVSRSHTTTHHSRKDSSGRVIRSSQRPLPDNTWLTTDKYPCPRWDSNPRSKQVSGLRPHMRPHRRINHINVF